MFLHRLSKILAPEFPKGLKWLNSDPLTMKRLVGKIVIIDFWTYSCVNCIRTIPYLKKWNDLYKKNGLVLIGVHTPEFGFEKDLENLKTAVSKFGINYPIVADPDYKIWNAYTNRWWPRTFLIDHKGSIVYDHIGEGGYAETETAIQRALTNIGQSDLPPIKSDKLIGGGICYRTTPEIYLGFLRGRYGNALDLLPNKEHVFTDEGDYDEDLVYLHGHWKVNGENIEHVRAMGTPIDYLALKYSAFSLNLVAGSLNKKPQELVVELDGRPILQDMAGEDLIIEDGISKVIVNEYRMYKVLKSNAYHKGILKIKTASGGLSLFAITFGGCE